MGCTGPGWWFQICFIFTRILGEVIHFDQYFSDRLKPPTSFPSKISGFEKQHAKFGARKANVDQKHGWEKGWGPFLGPPEKFHLELVGAHLVGGGLKYVFMFIPIPGQMIQFDNLINNFQIGWNHQLGVQKNMSFGALVKCQGRNRCFLNFQCQFLSVWLGQPTPP